MIITFRVQITLPEKKAERKGWMSHLQIHNVITLTRPQRHHGHFSRYYLPTVHSKCSSMFRFCLHGFCWNTTKQAAKISSGETQWIIDLLWWSCHSGDFTGRTDKLGSTLGKAEEVNFNSYNVTDSCHFSSLSLWVTHVLGVLKRGADLLSRENPLYGDGHLHPQVVFLLWKTFGQAAIDLCIMRNILLAMGRGCPSRLGSRPNVLLYTFPSLCLITTTLARIREWSLVLILIAPRWPKAA